MDSISDSEQQLADFLCPELLDFVLSETTPTVASTWMSPDHSGPPLSCQPSPTLHSSAPSPCESETRFGKHLHYQPVSETLTNKHLSHGFILGIHYYCMHSLQQYLQCHYT